jgi:hypothetical protein
MRALLPFLAALLTTAPAVADVDSFTTPSGNIQCSGGMDIGTPSDVICEIVEHSGPPPTKRLAECNDDQGYRFSMRERGRVSVECGPPGSRNTSPGGNVVRYGDTIEFDRILCRSSTRGLVCRNADGHGFSLSRRRQSVF